MDNLRQWVGSGVGLVIGLAEPIAERFVPRSIFEILGVAALPDDIQKWWAGAMWSVDHLRFWLPIALGLSVICWANWREIKMRVHSAKFRWLAVTGLIVSSFFVSGLLPEGITQTGGPSQPLQPGTDIVAPNNSGIITQGQTGSNIINQKPPQRVLNEQSETKILSMLPAGTHKIDLTSVSGDLEGARLSKQIEDFLRGKGFQVSGGNVGLYAGVPPVGVIIPPSLDPNGVEQITVGLNEVK